MLIDTHCHLAFSAFADEMDAIVDRAQENGVTRIIAIGTGLDDSRTNIALTERFPGTVYAAVGIHPCNVTDVTSPDWAAQLSEMATHPSVVAIGETGTDHFHDPPDGYSQSQYHALQDEFLAKHIEIAQASGKNLVIHQRESYDHTVALLSPISGTAIKAVLHCFVGSKEEATSAIAAGHLISFTGISTFKNAATVQETATSVPEGSFMVETDAPFLSPTPYRGKRCEPAFTRHTAEHIAALRNITLEELAAQTTHTAESFFNLPKP